MLTKEIWDGRKDSRQMPISPLDTAQAQVYRCGRSPFAAAAAVGLTFCLAAGGLSPGDTVAQETAAAVQAEGQGPGVTEDEARLAEAVFTLQSGTVSEAQIQEFSPELRGDLLSIFAARGEVDAVRLLIGLGIGADTRNSTGQTALVSAVLADSLATAQVLIEAGAKTDTMVDGMTVAEVARFSGSDEMARLIVGGAAPDQGDVLRRAARDNDLPEVQRLLTEGADPNAADAAGYTPLIAATLAGAGDAMKLLLAAGAKPNAETSDGLTPAVAAIIGGDADALALLLDGGVSPDSRSRGVPLLSLAVVSGQNALVDLLLAKGADPEQKSDDGARPASVAKALGQDRLTTRLGGTPELKAAPDLFAAIRNNDSLAVLEALEAGADPNQIAPDGTLALFAALATAGTDVVNHLIIGGASPFSIGPNQSTSIHAAFLNGDRRGAVANAAKLIAVARHARQQGDRTLLATRDASGRSALTRIVTATAGWDHLRELISEIGRTDVRMPASAPDKDGVSPYLAAVLTDNIEMLKVFATAGAIPPRGRSGESLQDIARARKSWGVLAALPDDRPIPGGFKKGASLEVKKEMQRRLQQWGYYNGAIDGIFGAGSTAAMTQFLLDQREELMQLAKQMHSPVWMRKYNTPIDDKTTLSIGGYRPGWCEWRVVEWNVKKGINRSDKFVGCVAAGKQWNSNGFAYVHYGDGSEGVFLFGENGWDDEVSLR